MSSWTETNEVGSAQSGNHYIRLDDTPVRKTSRPTCGARFWSVCCAPFNWLRGTTTQKVATTVTLPNPMPPVDIVLRGPTAASFPQPNSSASGPQNAAFQLNSNVQIATSQTAIVTPFPPPSVNSSLDGSSSDSSPDSSPPKGDSPNTTVHLSPVFSSTQTESSPAASTDLPFTAATTNASDHHPIDLGLHQISSPPETCCTRVLNCLGSCVSALPGLAKTGAIGLYNLSKNPCVAGTLLVVASGGVAGCGYLMGTAASSSAATGLLASTFAFGYTVQNIAARHVRDSLPQSDARPKIALLSDQSGNSISRPAPASCIISTAKKIDKAKQHTTFENFYTLAFIATVPTWGLIVGGSLATFLGGVKIGEFLEDAIEGPEIAQPRRQEVQGSMARSAGRICTFIRDNAIPLTALASGVVTASVSTQFIVMEQGGLIVWSTATALTGGGVMLGAGATGYIAQTTVTSRLSQLNPDDARNCQGRFLSTINTIFSLHKPLMIGGSLSLYARATTPAVMLIALGGAAAGQGVNLANELPCFGRRERRVYARASSNEQIPPPLRTRVQNYLSNQLSWRNAAFKVCSAAILTGSLAMYQTPGWEGLGKQFVVAWSAYHVTPLFTSDPVYNPALTPIETAARRIIKPIKFVLRHPQIMSTVGFTLNYTSVHEKIDMTYALLPNGEIDPSTQFADLWNIIDPLVGIQYGSYRILMNKAKDNDIEGEGSYKKAGMRTDLATMVVLGVAAKARQLT